MASNLKYSAALKNAQLNQITSQAGANTAFDIYAGAQPASPDVAITGQTLLATLPCSATLAGAAAAGVLTLNAITNGTGLAAAGAGTLATFFRMRTSGGTAVIDGTVGTSLCDLNLVGSAVIATGQPVQCASFTYSSNN